MSYFSKRTLVSTFFGVLLVLAYILYVTGEHAPAVEDVKAWAVLMLIFIGIGVVSQIVIQILFHVFFAIGVAVKEHEQDDQTVERIISASMVEDERDKLIQLKTSHTGYIFSGIGMVSFLAALALEQPIVTGLHVLLGALFVGTLIEGIAGIIMQERGVSHG